MQIDAKSTRILSTQEAAAFLRVHPATIKRLVERGQLRAARIGDLLRIQQEDLQALFELREVAR
jgi:excisionase family DNA binding protein